MRGIERRQGGRGRRASDGDASTRAGAGAPLWVRVVVLTVALILALYFLLYARLAADDPRISDERQAVELQSAAAVAAARTEAQIARAEAAMRRGAALLAANPTRPLDAVEAARSQAPDIAFAVIDAEGQVRAVQGAAATALTPPAGHTQRVAPGAERGALLVRGAPGGAGLVARVLPPFGETPVVAATADGAILAAGPASIPAANLAGLDLTPEAVARAAADATILQARDAEGRSWRAAVEPMGDSGLVVATLAQAAPTGWRGLMDHAWMLLAPLALGSALTALLWIQGRRGARVSRRWADSEQRFRVAVEAARCGVWEWDLERDQVVLSDFMARMFGFERGGAMTTDDILERVTPRHRETLVHALRQAAAYGAFDLTFRVDPPGGTPVWLDARGQARGERGASGFTQILGVAIDITEARRAKAQAQAAENRLRDGIESVSDAFVLFDRQGRLILWNRAFQDAFGFDDRHLRRGAQKDELNRIAALAIKSDHPSVEGRAGVREVELHDGRWLQLSERFTGDGGSVVTAADITVIKRQEAERQRSADHLRAMVTELETSQEQLALLARKYEGAMVRAEAANQAKSEFLANMSHELRTPLNAINGFSEIMAGEMFGPLGDSRYKGYAQDILNSGQHLLALINDILDMAKIEAGKMTLRYEPVDLSDVCQDAIRLMRGRAEESGLTLMLEAGDLPEVEADYRALKQVLLNLLSNAIKFTPAGGRITVQLEGQGDQVRLSVTDTGIGIAAADLERLAKPFEQVEGQHSKTTQGTGLGLALTKSLIEMHGGAMTIESEPGQGTTIAFHIPLNRPQPETQAEAA